MNPHDSANISGKVPATGRDSKILNGVQSIGVDHEIPIVLVNRRSLAAVPAIKEFRQSLLLDGVNDMHVEPSRITREDNGMCLRDKM